MGRLFALLLAFLGAAALSQAPEFAQQYIQRVAGAVDELRDFVEGFDADAGAAGVSREEALQAYAASGEFLSLQGVRTADTINRFERLDRHLVELRRANEYERTLLIAEQHDLPLLRATAQDYVPAMPLTMAGAIHAGVGFALGWALGIVLAALIGGLFSSLFRRRRPAY